MRRNECDWVAPMQRPAANGPGDESWQNLIRCEKEREIAIVGVGLSFTPWPQRDLVFPKEATICV